MVDLLGKSMSARVPRGSIPRWADRYGYSERAVKKFLDAGKKAGEMPPFDQPERMEEWAANHLPQITKRFRDAVAKAMGAESPVPPEEREEIEMPEIMPGEMGLEVQLSAYHREAALIRRLREKALTEQEFSKANAYLEQGQKVSAEIRQLERLLPTVLEQRGDYQRTADVREAVSEFLNILKRSLLGRAAKAGSHLRSATTDAEIQAVWKEEVQQVFRECCASGFGSTLTLE